MKQISSCRCFDVVYRMQNKDNLFIQLLEVLLGGNPHLSTLFGDASAEECTLMKLAFCADPVSFLQLGTILKGCS